MYKGRRYYYVQVNTPLNIFAGYTKETLFPLDKRSAFAKRAHEPIRPNPPYPQLQVQIQMRRDLEVNDASQRG